MLPNAMWDPEVVERVTCADVMRAARAGKASRDLVETARQTCQAGRALFWGLRRDLDCYLTMLFVLLARAGGHEFDEMLALRDSAVPLRYPSQDPTIIASSYNAADAAIAADVVRLSAPAIAGSPDRDDHTSAMHYDFGAAALARDQINDGLGFAYTMAARHQAARGANANVKLATDWQVAGIKLIEALSRRPIADLLAVMHATDMNEHRTRANGWTPPSSRRLFATYVADLLWFDRDAHAPFALAWRDWDDWNVAPEPDYDGTDVAARTPAHWTPAQVGDRLRRALAQATRVAATLNARDPASTTAAGAPLAPTEWSEASGRAAADATLTAYAGDARRFDWIDQSLVRTVAACLDANLPPSIVAALVDDPNGGVASRVTVGELRDVLRRAGGAPASRECRW